MILHRGRKVAVQTRNCRSAAAPAFGKRTLGFS
jgi:hypothetical protein